MGRKRTFGIGTISLSSEARSEELESASIGRTACLALPNTSLDEGMSGAASNPILLWRLSCSAIISLAGRALPAALLRSPFPMIRAEGGDPAALFNQLSGAVSALRTNVEGALSEDRQQIANLAAALETMQQQAGGTVNAQEVETRPPMLRKGMPFPRSFPQPNPFRPIRRVTAAIPSLGSFAASLRPRTSALGPPQTSSGTLARSARGDRGG